MTISRGAATAQARDQLERVILPFWLSRGVDRERGGFHTCFDNRGRERTSTDKFTWSQGRFVWLLARAAQHAQEGSLDLDPEPLLADAEAGARFLLDHAVHDDGTCAFRLTHEGTPVTDAGTPPRSVYADCFAAMGFAELARARSDDRWLDHAAPIVERAHDDILASTAPTPPYAIPEGYRAYGPVMILLNTLTVHAQAAIRLGRDRASLATPLAAILDRMLTHRRPDGTFAEMVPLEGIPGTTSLIDRHRVPGHAIEGLWVALEAIELLEARHHLSAVLGSVAPLCRSSWDDEHGGMLRYADKDGPGKPRGTTTGTPYERLVEQTWDTKLWWVHSEAAATTAVAAYRYGRAEAAEWFSRIWQYTLETFPAGDEGEEWIQIRDRTGRPLDQVVALPVKDPFHITRNLMQIAALDADLAVSP